MMHSMRYVASPTRELRVFASRPGNECSKLNERMRGWESCRTTRQDTTLRIYRRIVTRCKVTLRQGTRVLLGKIGRTGMAGIQPWTRQITKYISLEYCTRLPHRPLPPSEGDRRIMPTELRRRRRIGGNREGCLLMFPEISVMCLMLRGSALSTQGCLRSHGFSVTV